MTDLGRWIFALVFAMPSLACTVVCGQDVEVRNGFTVEVRFQGKPLEGASVEIMGHEDFRTTTFTTGTDGKAIVNVPEGSYFLTARKFGVVIGSECGIRVSAASGKRSFTYDWKDTPEPVGRVSGRFSHQLYGTQELAPLPSWKMILHAFDGPVRQASVAPEGTFDFGPLPEGLYVLEVPAADGARPILLRIDATSKRRDLDLILGGGLCGSAGILFRDQLEAPPQ